MSSWTIGKMGAWSLEEQITLSPGMKGCGYTIHHSTCEGIAWNNTGEKEKVSFLREKKISRWINEKNIKKTQNIN